MADPLNPQDPNTPQAPLPPAGWNPGLQNLGDVSGNEMLAFGFIVGVLALIYWSHGDKGRR